MLKVKFTKNPIPLYPAFLQPLELRKEEKKKEKDIEHFYKLLPSERVHFSGTPNHN